MAQNVQDRTRRSLRGFAQLVGTLLILALIWDDAWVFAGGVPCWEKVRPSSLLRPRPAPPASLLRRRFFGEDPAEAERRRRADEAQKRSALIRQYAPFGAGAAVLALIASKVQEGGSTRSAPFSVVGSTRRGRGTEAGNRFTEFKYDGSSFTELKYPGKPAAPGTIENAKRVWDQSRQYVVDQGRREAIKVEERNAYAKRKEQEALKALAKRKADVAKAVEAGKQRQKEIDDERKRKKAAEDEKKRRQYEAEKKAAEERKRLKAIEDERRAREGPGGPPLLPLAAALGAGYVYLTSTSSEKKEAAPAAEEPAAKVEAEKAPAEVKAAEKEEPKAEEKAAAEKEPKA